MIGAGQDNAILGEYAAQQGAGSTEVPVGALGAIYTKGSVSPGLPFVNKPSRFYSLALDNGPTLYLLNVDTMQWQQQSLTGIWEFITCGAMYLGNVGQSGTANTAFKCIIVGGAAAASSCWQIPCITVESTAVNTSSVAPQIRIGCGPSVYGVGTHIMKTIERVGIEFQQQPDLNQAAFNVTVTVDTGTDVSGGSVNNTGAIGSGAAQLAYPAQSSTLYTPCFAWFSPNGGTVTSRTPIVNITYPDDATSRCWPQIVRIVIEYTLGDDN
jgi:hypothetical protein